MKSLVKRGTVDRKKRTEGKCRRDENTRMDDCRSDKYSRMDDYRSDKKLRMDEWID